MTPTLIGYFILHLILSAGLYYLGAMAAASLIGLIANRRARAAGFLALVMAASAPAFLPNYGGAGIHGGNWGTLAWFFEILDGSHFGPWAAAKIYGGFLVLLAAACVYMLLRLRSRRKKARPHQTG
jgi:ABC-type multidrug transport system permease subunit